MSVVHHDCRNYSITCSRQQDMEEAIVTLIEGSEWDEALRLVSKSTILSESQAD